MTQVITDSAYYAAIADAIRAQNGSQATYTPAQMAAAVAAIDSASNLFDDVLEQGSFEANGTNADSEYIKAIRVRERGFTQVEPGESYEVVFDYDNSYLPKISASFYASSESGSTRVTNTPFNYGKRAVLEVPSGCSFIRLLFGVDELAANHTWSENKSIAASQISNVRITRINSAQGSPAED